MLAAGAAGCTPAPGRAVLSHGRSGVCHRWVTATLGRGAPARRGAAGGTRAWISGKRSAQRAGVAAQRTMACLSSQRAERGWHRASALLRHTPGHSVPSPAPAHVGVHGSLLPIVCQCRVKASCSPGPGSQGPFAAPAAAAGCRGAGWLRHSHSTKREQQLCERRCDPGSGRGCERGHRPPWHAGLAEPGCGEVPGVQRWDAGARARIRRWDAGGKSLLDSVG